MSFTGGKLPESVTRVINDDVTGVVRDRISKLPSDTSYRCDHAPDFSDTSVARSYASDDALYSRRVQRILEDLEEREDAMLQRDVLLKKRVELLKNRENFLQV